MNIRQATIEDIDQVSIIFAQMDHECGFNPSDHNGLERLVTKELLYVLQWTDQTINWAFAYTMSEWNCEIIAIASDKSQHWIWSAMIKYIGSICTEQWIPKIRCYSMDYLNARWFYERMWFQEQYLMKNQFFWKDCRYFGKILF
jgi:hypothetical protein